MFLLKKKDCFFIIFKNSLMITWESSKKEEDTLKGVLQAKKAN